jgi:hypothetical protein
MLAKLEPIAIPKNKNSSVRDRTQQNQMYNTTNDYTSILRKYNLRRFLKAFKLVTSFKGTGKVFHKSTA